MVFVAEAEGCVVGFASLYAPDAFLHHLYVDPARQGGGIGARLLAHVIAVSQAPLTLKCQRSNAQALRLYARHGFTEIGGGDDPLLGPWALLRAP